MNVGGVEPHLEVMEVTEADEAALEHREGHEEGAAAAEEGGDEAPEVGLVKEEVEVGERRSGEGGCGLGVRDCERKDEVVEVVALGLDGVVKGWM